MGSFIQITFTNVHIQILGYMTDLIQENFRISLNTSMCWNRNGTYKKNTIWITGVKCWQLSTILWHLKTEQFKELEEQRLKIVTLAHRKSDNLERGTIWLSWQTKNKKN